jgi:hypothetical protein
MTDPETGWEGDEDTERQWFEEAQELLKADAEAYWSWCTRVEREFEERQNA